MKETGVDKVFEDDRFILLISNTQMAVDMDEELDGVLP